MSPTGSLIATGGDDQKVRLFKSPVIIPKQKNKAFDVAVMYIVISSNGY